MGRTIKDPLQNLGATYQTQKKREKKIQLNSVFNFWKVASGFPQTCPKLVQERKLWNQT